MLLWLKVRGVEIVGSVENTIICSDVLDGLKSISDNTVHLTVTSPPYNVKLPYLNCGDDLNYSQYLGWLELVFSEVYRVSVNGARCAINIDATANEKEERDQEYVRCVYAHVYNFMITIGWKFRTEICWYKQNAVGKATAWGSYKSASNPFVRRNHEYVLIFTKGDWKLESEIPSDITKDEFHRFTLSMWYISPETRKLCQHPAPFPEELVYGLMKLFSFPKQIVLDPFNGIGTTSYVSCRSNRSYIGIDNCREYCDFALERIERAQMEDDLFAEV